MAEKQVPKIPAPVAGDEQLEAAIQDEIRAYATNTLDKKHKNQKKTALHYATIGLFWLVVSITAIAISILAWHYLMPPCWGWLSDKQIDKVQTIIFSGAAAALLQGVARKFLNDVNSN